MLNTIYETWNQTVLKFKNTNINKTNEVYNRLVSLYTSPDRVFHSIDSIEHMLSTLQTLTDIYKFNQETQREIRLALFFHYTSYHPSKNHNEFDSATLADHYMKLMGLDENTIESVTDLMYSSCDPGFPTDLKEEVYNDSIKSIYAKPTDEYTHYMYRMWAEYRLMGFDQFISKRKEFLVGLLQNNSIFYTEYMKEMYTAQALHNINRELSMLDKMSVDELIKELEGNL